VTHRLLYLAELLTGLTSAQFSSLIEGANLSRERFRSNLDVENSLIEQIAGPLVRRRRMRNALLQGDDQAMLVKSTAYRATTSMAALVARGRTDDAVDIAMLLIINQPCGAFRLLLPDEQENPNRERD
jgi:hypothetical protein